MTVDQSAQTTPRVPPHRTPSPPPDTLYGVFEDTIATIEELVFPVDSELSTSLLDASTQDFLEDLLDQLIRWGVEIYGRSGSLRVVTGHTIGDYVYAILVDMQDELEVIQLQAERRQKTSGKTYIVGKKSRQAFSQALVNLRGFTPLICTNHAIVMKAEATGWDGTVLQGDQAEAEEGEVIESIEGIDETCDGLFVKQAPTA